MAIKQHALEIGFDLAGIAPLAAWKDLEFSRRWVAQGFGGEMKYLENPRRLDPRTLLAAAQSVICVGLIYNAPLPYSEEVRSQKSGVRSQSPGLEAPDSGGSGRLTHPETRTPRPEPRGWISRYAWGRDYHKIMRAKLEALRGAIESLAPGAETRVYVDTGPIVERAFARLSGIGWMGKNTCLINQQKGSWFFLGVVLCSLELNPDLPAPDRCGSCTRCIEACPTKALEPYVMNASRCISYLN
ncbi:MAG: epoxyqueuosine reductase, partial [Deltaproteobacteria bacterium]